MKIGYPCINRSVGCTANTTFRLRNYSEENLINKVQANLECLKKTLEYNLKNDLLFFRIGSQLIPFASHPVCKFNWQKYFEKELERIGNFIEKNNFRISMHPDQFTLINAKDENILNRSIKEIKYHCDVLNALKLDKTAKIQIHVGGVYNEKEKSIQRFIDNYLKLPKKIKDRLVIENDDKSYNLKDCLFIHKKTKIPILFDSFHHECLNNGETVEDALKQTEKTWQKDDGLLMVDYSSQKPEARKGSHIESINLKHFEKFLKQTKGIDFDIMLEIKDKENSALLAKKLLN